jgi:nucleosome binding factor SPN SPT16 subunit
MASVLHVRNVAVARDNPRDFFDMEGGWTALFGASDDEEEDELDEACPQAGAVAGAGQARGNEGRA